MNKVIPTSKQSIRSTTFENNGVTYNAMVLENHYSKLFGEDLYISAVIVPNDPTLIIETGVVNFGTKVTERLNDSELKKLCIRAMDNSDTKIIKRLDHETI